ncbi:unnamed protein product, partial [Meganyctiphanes norvegica]
FRSLSGSMNNLLAGQQFQGPMNTMRQGAVQTSYNQQQVHPQLMVNRQQGYPQSQINQQTIANQQAIAQQQAQIPNHSNMLNGPCGRQAIVQQQPNLSNHQNVLNNSCGRQLVPANQQIHTQAVANRQPSHPTQQGYVINRFNPQMANIKNLSPTSPLYP